MADVQEERRELRHAEGRVLSRPVKDRRGRTLIPSGTTLSSKHLEELDRMGIRAVWLKKQPAGDLQERLEHMFQEHDDPLMQAIQRAAREILERDQQA